MSIDTKDPVFIVLDSKKQKCFIFFGKQELMNYVEKENVTNREAMDLIITQI